MYYTYFASVFSSSFRTNSLLLEYTKKLEYPVVNIHPVYRRRAFERLNPFLSNRVYWIEILSPLQIDVSFFGFKIRLDLVAARKNIFLKIRGMASFNSENVLPTDTFRGVAWVCLSCYSSHEAPFPETFEPHPCFQLLGD